MAQNWTYACLGGSLHILLAANVLMMNAVLQEYTKNIQKGRLNDYTIWLWNDRRGFRSSFPRPLGLTYSSEIEGIRDQQFQARMY